MSSKPQNRSPSELYRPCGRLITKQEREKFLLEILMTLNTPVSNKVPAYTFRPESQRKVSIIYSCTHTWILLKCICEITTFCSETADIQISLHFGYGLLTFSTEQPLMNHYLAWQPLQATTIILQLFSKLFIRAMQIMHLTIQKVFPQTLFKKKKKNFYQSPFFLKMRSFCKVLLL